MNYKQTTIAGQRYYLVPVDTVIGRPKKLDTDSKKFLRTLLYQKSYMKRKELAEYYNVSEPTISRALRKAKDLERKKAGIE